MVEVDRGRTRSGAGSAIRSSQRGRVGDAVLAVGHVDHVLERRQPGTDRLDVVAAVDVAVAPAVAADREQHLGLDLGEAVDDAACPELRRAARPDGAEAGRGGERDQRLGDVGQVGDDAVAGPDAEALEAGPGPRDLVAQLARRSARIGSRVCERAMTATRVEVLVGADQVLGVVERRAGEPAHARHLVRAQDLGVRRVRADLGELPDRGPEALEVRDRPARAARRGRRTRRPRCSRSQSR